MDLDYFIGLMSGTSLDGVDCVIMSFSNKRPQLIASVCTSYPDKLKQALQQLITKQQASLVSIGELDQALGKHYANCVNQLLASQNINPKQIKAIGCHGQTIFHQPAGEHRFSWQLGSCGAIGIKNWHCCG